MSATFGVPGASVNVGPRGIHSTIGIPGTGISYQSNLTPNGRGAANLPPGASPDGVPPEAYWHAPQMRAINSASVEQLTSERLIELREMIAQARIQRAEVEADLLEAKQMLERDQAELDRRSSSWFRAFYKRRIAELASAISGTFQEVERLTGWAETTHIDISFETGDSAKKAYGALQRTFEELRGCSRVWDITADRIGNRVIERSYASRSVIRTPASLDYADSDLVRFAGQAMRFQNTNGEDILIYPGMAIMPRSDGAFALIDLREIKLECIGLQFVEDDAVPPDTRVVGRTWAKVNKDGSPDLRFRDNYEIPICLYGRMIFSTLSGVEEEYQTSSDRLANNFAVAFANYQAALREIQ